MASLKKWLDRRRNPWKGVFYDAFSRWQHDNGSAKLYDYSGLPDNAVAFDFGAYRGEWADRVLHKPGLTCHMFEPHPRFAAALATKYDDQPRAHVHPFALGGASGELPLSDSDDGSSAVAAHDRALTGEIRSVAQFFADHEVTNIDIAKINIEGGEYDLLPALIAAGILPHIDRLQVQFHLFSPDLIDARDTIRAALAQTHNCVWEYPFVWEEWHRKLSPQE